MINIDNNNLENHLNLIKFLYTPGLQPNGLFYIFGAFLFRLDQSLMIIIFPGLHSPHPAHRK